MCKIVLRFSILAIVLPYRSGRVQKLIAKYRTLVIERSRYYGVSFGICIRLAGVRSARLKSFRIHLVDETQRLHDRRQVCACFRLVYVQLTSPLTRPLANNSLFHTFSMFI